MLFVFRVGHAFLSVHCSLVVTCWERADILARLYIQRIWMLLNIILSYFQQYRTLQAKVIQFFLSLVKNVKIKETSF